VSDAPEGSAPPGNPTAACVGALAALFRHCRSGEVVARIAAAANCVAVLASTANGTTTTVDVAADPWSIVQPGLGAEALADAHAVVTTLRAAGVAKIELDAMVDVDALLAFGAAMVASADGHPAPPAVPASVRVERFGDERLRAVQRGGHTGGGGDSALRSVFLQHRLIAGVPSVSGLSPVVAKAILQRIVDRLLAVPGGLEPLILLQQDPAVLSRSLVVAVLSVVVARAAGWPESGLTDLGAAGLLHDLGALLDEARPGVVAFAWLLERGVDDFWLRCALVARHWREGHGGLATLHGGRGAAAVVALAVQLAAGRTRPQLDAAAVAGTFPPELLAIVPAGLLAAPV
jgi:hypothetical protein